MKILILATAAIVIIPSLAITRQCVAGENAQNASVIIAVSDPQKAGTVIELAMGPTSAPQKPGGPVNGPTTSPSKCTSFEPCPNLHKKAKHRHKKLSWN